MRGAIMLAFLGGGCSFMITVLAFLGGGCSFMITVPDELPADRAKLDCARDGSCCPDTWFFPILDGAAAVATTGSRSGSARRRPR